MTDHVLTPLCELARHHGTDKGGWHTKFGNCHNYTPAYYELFRGRRHRIKHVLEIGILDGASLRMWQDFFPYAVISGIDHNPASLVNQQRIHSYLADQGDPDALRAAATAILADAPPFDLIVDDGSHVPEHQTGTANVLKDYLAPNGLYVIEDIFYDCHPETITSRINWGQWTAIPVGIGLGGARCECGCGQGEVLLVGTSLEEFQSN